MTARGILLIGLALLSGSLFAQEKKEISLLFIGDVMQHQSQINHAYNPNTKTYEYDPCFEEVSSIIEQSDFCIANLEVTLAGPPYKGYPQFSSPDELASALKRAGVDMLVTANNHSCDRRKKGLERTINTLENLGMEHTGTFINSQTRKLNYPYMIEEKGFKLALLNYTYGTNGLPVDAPNVVNLINRDQILVDIKKAKDKSPDKIIAFLHWGPEYRSTPSSSQTQLADFLIKNGVDIIIGSHPHVLQPMENYYDENLNKDIVKVYSLGNYISNQRDRYRDGGAMSRIVLEKDENGVRVKNTGYYLTWVQTKYVEGRKRWIILPVSKFENSTELDAASKEKMDIFIKDSRKLMEEKNLNVFEYNFDPESDSWTLH